MTASDRLLVVEDFNCPHSSPVTVNPALSDVFDVLNMTQYVQLPTRQQNLLDLFVTDSSLLSYLLSVTRVTVGDAPRISVYTRDTEVLSVSWE